MKKYNLFARALDVALIAALVYGSADVRLFGFWLISILTMFVLIGALSMSAELAEKIHGRKMLKKAVGISIAGAYVVALIYAGFPILAAVYAIVSLILRVVAETKLEEQAKKEARP